MSFKSPAVNAVGIIENTVQMRVFLVDMTGHKILIFAFEKFLTYLLTDLQCSFGSDLPRLETDDKVLGEDGASSRSACPNLLKLTVSSFRIGTAPLRENQSAVICLVGISDVL